LILSSFPSFPFLTLPCFTLFFQALEHEKNLAVKQVRGLSDHYEESVAENIRKDKIIAELTHKHNDTLVVRVLV
jgi:hypothetical protein